jgi:D-alanyl-lipoteichoic acid acyltransferase DltB (MBOAT superfamily)
VPLSSLALHAGRLVVWFVIHSMTLCLLPLAQLPWFAPDIYDTLIAPHAWRVFFVTMFILVDNYVRLVVIFRFARLLAIVDGVDVPDDMLRCPFAQHSFTMFWRSWHSRCAFVRACDTELTSA